jgi:hypothetical protein
MGNEEGTFFSFQLKLKNQKLYASYSSRQGNLNNGLRAKGLNPRG